MAKKGRGILYSYSFCEKNLIWIHVSSTREEDFLFFTVSDEKKTKLDPCSVQKGKENPNFLQFLSKNANLDPCQAQNGNVNPNPNLGACLSQKEKGNPTFLQFILKQTNLDPCFVQEGIVILS